MAKRLSTPPTTLPAIAPVWSVEGRFEVMSIAAGAIVEKIGDVEVKSRGVVEGAKGDEGIEISKVNEVAEDLVLKEVTAGELPVVARAHIWLVTLVVVILQC